MAFARFQLVRAALFVLAAMASVPAVSGDAVRSTPEPRSGTTIGPLDSSSASLRAALTAVQHALSRNDRAAFDRELARVRSLIRSGETSSSLLAVVDVYTDIERLWNAQYASPFFGPESSEYAIASRYPGWDSAIHQSVLTDARGRRFFPAGETRAFMAEVAELMVTRLDTPVRAVPPPAPRPTPAPVTAPRGPATPPTEAPVSTPPATSAPEPVIPAPAIPTPAPREAAPMPPATASTPEAVTPTPIAVAPPAPAAQTPTSSPEVTAPSTPASAPVVAPPSAPQATPAPPSAEATPSRTTTQQTIVFPLVVNEVRKGDVLAILEGEDLQLRTGDLEEAGLSKFAGQRIRRGAEEWVVMSTVPDVTYRVDEEALTLHLQAAPQLLGTTVERLRGNAPLALNYSKDPSAFINYSLTSGGFNEPGVAVEAGGSWGNRHATTTISRMPSGSAIRGTSSIVLDDPDAMSRWTFGDAYVSTDPLGGSDLLGGVTFSRDFALQPYFVRYPSFGFSGAATTPSEVEIYVNGVLSARRQLGPGEFRLEDLPVVSGAGDTRIVIRDAFGREQVYASPYYYSTLNLGKGISDFSYSVGFRRQEFGRSSFDYGDPALVAFHRKGITERLTLGGRVEASENLVSGGGSVTAALPFGEVEGLLGASEAEGESGVATALTYRWIARRGNFGGTFRSYSDAYSNISLSPLDDRVSNEISLFGGYRLGRGSLSARVSTTEYRDRGDEQRVTLNGNYTLTRNMTLIGSAGHGEIDGEPTTEVFAGVSIFLDRHITTNLGVSHRDGETAVRADLQRPLPVGTGYGYRIQTGLEEGEENANVAAQYQTGFGRYEVTVDPSDAGNATLSASGGVVWIGNRFLPTRAVQQSYALARVGVPNVRVYARNLEVGRTDPNGDLLIPDLLPYYGNAIRIEDEDVPVTFEIAKTEEIVAPPVRGGALVEFPVRKIQTAFGTLRIVREGNVVVPEFGQLTLEAEGVRRDSPIGRDGSFYLENLPAATYDATVLHKTGICHFKVTIPDSNEQMLTLGELRCEIK